MEPVIAFKSPHRHKAKNTVAEMLRVFRMRSKLTQSELARQLGLQTDRMVRKWETGQSLPESGRLKKLIEFYLKNSTFTRGREKEEVYQLWEAIKELFDSQNTSFATYTIFDAAWFEYLLQSNAKGQLPTSLAMPAGPPSRFQAGSNLPISLNSFVGRKFEQAQLEKTLKISRLLTLSGAPGVGKTRLAHEVVLTLGNTFKDGVYLLELDSLSGPESLLQLIGKELELDENFKGDIAELIRFLRGKEVLLVLDSFDQLIPKGAGLLYGLLKSCPGLKIVVTSRESLDIPGEAVFHLKPLDTFPPEAGSGQGAEITGLSESGQLFVERARAVQLDFEPTPQTTPIINEICRQLDGLPLAIELAASFMEVLTVVELSDRLTDPFRLLKRKIKDYKATDPHQSLEKTFEWSFTGLNPYERFMLKLLCDLPGPFEIGTAQQTFFEAHLDETQSLNVFDNLIKKSLVEVDMQGEVLTFSLLKTVRDYSLKQK